MTSVLELTDWLGKQRRGYHKHDGFPEHPVRVKHHQEYFASHTEEPDQPLSSDETKKNISDIYDDVRNLLIPALREGDKSDVYASHYVENWDVRIEDLPWGKPSDNEKYYVSIGNKLDKILSDEDFAQLLQGLANSHSSERLEAERAKLKEILAGADKKGLKAAAHHKNIEIREKIDKINNQERFIKDIVLGTRPIPVLMDNIATLVNSDKWYMQEIASDLIKVDPTADFLMDMAQDKKFDSKVRSNAILALDAKRFDEFMIENSGAGDKWISERFYIPRTDEEMYMFISGDGVYKRDFENKLREVESLHNAFGKDAVNHFIEHLEFPEDVQFDVEDTFNVMKKDPGAKAKNLFISLYKNTQFGQLHELSMNQWEASSSSDWGGLLKDSIGRQLDGDVVHHSGPTIDKLKEEYLISQPKLSYHSEEGIEGMQEGGMDGTVTLSYKTTQDNLDKYVITHQKAIRKVLDAVYKDQDYIPVYRGTSSGTEIEELTSLEDFKMDDWNPIDVKGNPVSSYTLDSKIAYKFSDSISSGWIISSLVHKDDIWSNFWSHSYQGNEREFLIINKERESLGISTDTLIATDIGMTGKGSPLASEYTSFGFIGDNEPWVISDYQTELLEHLVDNIETPNDDIGEHKYHFSNLYSALQNWMTSDDGKTDMPAYKALELWDEAKKNPGWKQSPALGADKEGVKALFNQLKTWTQVLEDKAGNEINSSKSAYTAHEYKQAKLFMEGGGSLAESNASKIVKRTTEYNGDIRETSVKQFLDDLELTFPGTKENKFNPKWYAENFTDGYDLAKKWNDEAEKQGQFQWISPEKQIEEGMVDEEGNPIYGTEEDQRNDLYKVTAEAYGEDIWDWVQENLNNEELGVTKSQWISKQSSRMMLVPYRTMINRPGKSPYFATRWKKVTVPQRTSSSYNVIPLSEYKGNIQDIYSAWKGYVGDSDEGRHDLFLPIIALQEIIYKGLDGLLATFNNRIVGVVSLHINQAEEARLSILSASPFDIVQGTENRIEDMLRRGVEIYVKNKGWDYIGIDGDNSINHGHTETDKSDVDIEKARGQLIPVKVPITLPSGKKTEAIRWKKGKSDPKAYADFDDVFEALSDDPKMKEYLEGVVNKVPSTWQRESLELDMSTGNNVIARAINGQGKWSYIFSTEKSGEKREAKHIKVEKFNKALPKIRNDIERGLKRGDEEAIILHLIDVAGLRIGDEINNGEAFDRNQPKNEDGEFPRVPTYAARQLLGKHVSVDGTKVRLKYPSKHNEPLDKTIDNAFLAKFFSDKKKTAGDEDKLFESSAGKVRGYFQKLGGGNQFKVHNFRHHHATRLVIDKLKGYPMPTVDSEDISKTVRRAEIKQIKSGGRKKLSQSDRKAIVEDFVAKQFKVHQLKVAETSAEFLVHTANVSFDDYILPTVWAEWDREQGKIVREHLSNPEPEPKKVRKIKRTVDTIAKQDDYNPDEYQPWEDMDDLFERTIYDEENTLDDNEDIFPEDIEERKEQEASDEGWQYPIELSKSTASITEAKRRGLVPQSGDWGKPRRWVRPKDADVPVKENRELTKLPEDTWKYFKEVPGTILVDIDKLTPIRARPEGIIEANKRMQGDTRRKPLDLKDNGDGTYTILDGNSTYANAVDSEWEKLPGVVVEEEKPRKKASEDVPISQLTIDAMKAVFSDDFSMSDFQDMYSIGLDGYSTNIVGLRGRAKGITPHTVTDRSKVTIEVEILDDDENYTDDEEYEKQPKGIDGYTPLAGTMSRTFTREKDGTLSVKHNHFIMENHFQGKGIASNINEHVEKEYEKLGVDNIMLNANAKIGGYAWARQGYDFETENEREEMQDAFNWHIEHMDILSVLEEEEFINQVDVLTHAWQFAEWNPTDEPHGQHLGKEIMLGTTWNAAKTLDKKSQGYQRGKIYFALKRKHNVQG